MKWSSHYIPIQAPIHERSIEIQSFENIHLVLFLDFQISLGILLIYRAPNTKDFSEKLLKLLFNVAIKIIRFIVFLNTHAPLPLHPNWKKNPWFNSTEIFSWYFHISFFNIFWTWQCPRMVHSSWCEHKNSFYFCLLFSSDHSLLCFMSPMTQSTLSKHLIHSHR